MDQTKENVVQCSGTLAACTVALNDMRDAANRSAQEQK
jgi:hypothetical protein